MKHLDLADGIRSTVYTIIVGQLQADPTLLAVINPNGWQTYLEENDDTPLGEDSLPSLETLPFGGPSTPATLVTQDSPMGISICIATEGLDPRDLMNLWEAVEAALWKGSGPSGLLSKLSVALNLLPRKGQVAQVSLSTPAITPSATAAGKQYLAAAGTIHVQLRIPK